ncbi:MAG: integrase, partial [Gammaproteobacteria bacterium]|nr:integrase [Gammaproteobacteria bacterium]
MPERTRSCVQVAAKQLQLSVTHAYRLMDRYQADPRLTSLLPARRGRKHGHRRLPEMVEEIIQAATDEMYLTRQKASLTALIAEIRRRCRSLDLPSPSRNAVRLRLTARPVAHVVARREGRKAARDRFAPAIGRLEAPWPLSLVQIDHTLVDVIVVDSVTRAPIQRPWLTLSIDVCSRCVPGFYLSLEPPSATSVALCITQSALPKEGWLAARGVEEVWPVSGVPGRLHLDNAREFRSEALRRGCEQYGIGIHYRPVRMPHYGGHIERLIGTMMGKVHLLPGTTFSDVRVKGDLDPQKYAVMTLQDLESWLAHAIAGDYHRNIHSALNMPPLAAWERGIVGDNPTSGRGRPVAVSDPRRFLIDFLPIERRLVRRDGILLNSIHYWSDALSIWIGRPEKMILRYDPRDLSRIYLLAPDGHYYDVGYRDVRRPPISLWEHRLALKRLRDEGRALVDEAAIFRTVEHMRKIAEEAIASSKTARRQRERLRVIQEGRAAPTVPPVNHAVPISEASD